MMRQTAKAGELAVEQEALRFSWTITRPGQRPQEARAWCETDTRVVCGKPYEEILRVARNDGADLIVLGVHGHGPVDRVLFGSTAQQVVRQAPCPLLTVRP